MDSVVVDMDLPDHALVKEASHFSELTAKGHEPLIVARSAPIGRYDLRGGHKPVVLEIARHEILCKELFTRGRPSLPAKDHMLLARTPIVQCSGWVSRTIDGPAPHLPWPSVGEVAVG